MNIVTLNLQPGVIYKCGEKEFTNIGGELFEKSYGDWEWSALMVNNSISMAVEIFEEKA